MESGEVPGAPRTHHLPSCPRAVLTPRVIPWGDSAPAPRPEHLPPGSFSAPSSERAYKTISLSNFSAEK